jgi:hypothetical protein
MASQHLPSVVFNVYSKGKAAQIYKYEDLYSLSFVTDKLGKRQINTVLKSNMAITHQIWGLEEEDVALTQSSVEAAERRYNDYLVRLSSGVSSSSKTTTSKTTEPPTKKRPKTSQS